MIYQEIAGYVPTFATEKSYFNISRVVCIVKKMNGKLDKLKIQFLEHVTFIWKRYFVLSLFFCRNVTSN